MKPGYKTTEFWLKLLALVAAFLLSSGLFPAGHVVLKVAGVVASILGALGYSYLRTHAKAGGAVPDEVQAALAAQRRVLVKQQQQAITRATRDLSLRHELSELSKQSENPDRESNR